MSLLKEVLEFNRQFVENKEFEKYQADKFPDKRLVILSCMDTRLTELLPKALNFKNGDVKLVKDAGAIVSHPFGSVMRSLLIAVYELQADEIMVIGHHGCGMSAIDPSGTLQKMIDAGVPKESIEILENAGIDLHSWLHGFESVEDSVRKSVDTIRNHPLLAKKIPVHGLVIDPKIGKLDLLVNGYKD